VGDGRVGSGGGRRPHRGVSRVGRMKRGGDEESRRATREVVGKKRDCCRE
jgi:hypothetical protein